MKRFFRELIIYIFSFLIVFFLATQLFSIEKVPNVVVKREESIVPEKKTEISPPPEKPKQEITQTETVKQKSESETYTQIVYEVKVGDTIIGIGQKFSINWRELARINNLKDPNKLYVGQKLIIPVKKD
ncbi:MAG: peptidoglycan-binding protein LysM [Dictyoglomus sp. NZ13-RE01]|nr:MAG: peptidoglycan-binding protein LysM [Dictyoglomus sp. NZ13-RE01]